MCISNDAKVRNIIITSPKRIGRRMVRRKRNSKDGYKSTRSGSSTGTTSEVRTPSAGWKSDKGGLNQLDFGANHAPYFYEIPERKWWPLLTRDHAVATLCIRQIAFNWPPQYPTGVECVAHTKQGLINAVVYLLIGPQQWCASQLNRLNFIKNYR